MTRSKGVILLDRDGVLNQMVIDPEQGTVDSPLHPDQVQVFPWVPEALYLLTQEGYEFSIVTNQPAAAKNKTTLKNLEEVHEKVLREAQSGGATISTSQICFHRAEDLCSCRKPKTELLEKALAFHQNYQFSKSWMVGDGLTDIQAGAALKLRTAYVGSRKLDIVKIFDEHQIMPSLWCNNLMDFAKTVIDSKKETPRF